MAVIDDFLKLDIRIGKVIRAENFPEAKKPAYKLLIDFGSLGVKHSSAQITKNYKPGELTGKLVVAVVNFPPRKIAGFKSEVLVLGAVPNNGNVVLLKPDFDVIPGAKVF
ncbi:MAG: tRNA-binding protein [Spirochaetales bacterium]|nr:tRNA-binding protein [Spirochaetales bacterium]